MFWRELSRLVVTGDIEEVCLLGAENCYVVVFRVVSLNMDPCAPGLEYLGIRLPWFLSSASSGLITLQTVSLDRLTPNNQRSS